MCLYIQLSSKTEQTFWQLTTDDRQTRGSRQSNKNDFIRLTRFTVCEFNRRAESKPSNRHRGPAAVFPSVRADAFINPIGAADS